MSRTQTAQVVVEDLREGVGVFFRPGFFFDLIVEEFLVGGNW